MKKLFFALAVFILGMFRIVLPVQAQTQLTEEIPSFNSDITINQDTSIKIREEIQYTTTLSKHGIYRYIPVSYNKDGVKETLRISKISVQDKQGRSIQYTRFMDGPYLTLKIGDPDVTFTGDKTYVITYTVERAINQLEDHVELYWDITGEGWKIPISSTTATIHSEFAPITEVACFSGQYGTDDGLCETSYQENTATFSYSETINYGDNLTLAIKFPLESSLQFPTQSDLMMLWLKHNWPLLLIPLPLLGIILMWNKKGRDIQFVSPNVYDMNVDQPTQKRPISLKAREPFVYEPLKDLTPGEAGALIDERVDTQDIIAEILELVHKKYAKVEVIEKKNFLFGKTRDYQFTKLKPADAQLPEVQKYLHGELFKKNPVVKISELKGTFYRSISAAQALMEKSLTAKKVYVQSPGRARAMGILAYVGMVGIAVFAIVTVFFPLNIIWPLPVLLIQVPFGMMIAYNMTQKSAVGTNLWLQARGLRKTITYGKWREEIKEKQLFIEEVLPFAVALGVVDRLAKDMDELGLEPPDYLNSAALTTWNTSQFVRGFSQEMGSSLSYNPSSSSSSGSGFSGGGSSGGGGGGGGGGSW
ncbi:MAG: DUF2207 domain-containing protein [Pseudomonadales bacterium]|nr:DUF2207 domain-containing protein [Candidatus Woesebacteria bacterium]MCB9801179.1 DUF2207 domain-containing protein [Pseudomonadales bacterium]